MSTADRSLPLRERKKRRVRRTLSDTALRLFLSEGFQETTLERLVDEAEVSMRTFFRYFPSKEHVALAAEGELWEALVADLCRREIHGTLLGVLRESMLDSIRDMGEDWERRFIATRGLAARTPVLRDFSELSSIRVQRQLVEVLEEKLGIDGREDVRLRLVGEFALSAWRCGAKNWVRGGRKHGKGRGGRTELIRRVAEAFDAIPASLTMTAPDHKDAPEPSTRRG